MAPPRKDRICERCGAVHHRRKSLYCSAKCGQSASADKHRARLTGMPGMRAKNGVEKPCTVCGRLFYAPASQAHQRRCSKTCYLSARWPESHKETRQCAICGQDFVALQSHRKVTCGSADCRREHKSRRLRGENCHFWRGGKTAPYHKEWKSIRRQALERDGYRCTQCGEATRIQVHHVVPYRYSQSHAIENLVTLCRPCHSREELRVNVEFREGLRQRWPSGRSVPEPA
jgi:5-methylcytosine-specific restriction endonuclease McrA